jgi:hypothetical protein
MLHIYEPTVGTRVSGTELSIPTLNSDTRAGTAEAPQLVPLATWDAREVEPLGARPPGSREVYGREDVLIGWW